MPDPNRAARARETAIVIFALLAQMTPTRLKKEWMVLSTLSPHDFLGGSSVGPHISEDVVVIE